MTQGLVIAGAFLPVSLLIFAAILANPGASRMRRIGAAIVDAGVCNVLHGHVRGNRRAALRCLPVVTFGNGFRYGRPYLYHSLAWSAAGSA